MMKGSGRRIRQSSSIHQRIRSACFVDYDYHAIDTFKYRLRTKIEVGSDRLIRGLRFIGSSITNKSVSMYNTVIWDRLVYHACIWLVEAFIEGFTINYVLYVLVGLDFNVWTIFAYGMLIKQSIDIYWRMKVDGADTAIPEKGK